MTILIIEDNIHKCRRVEDVLKKLEINFKTVHAINPAKKILTSNEEIDGIVLDMQLPLYENEMATMKNDGGEILLTWLKHRNSEIPVLGNSTQNFYTNYQYFVGRMPGFYDSVIFEKFLSLIKDHM